MADLSQYRLQLSPAQREQIRQAAHRAYPAEACGFVTHSGTVVEVLNRREPPEFEISADDYARWADAVDWVWHSHANNPTWSAQDLRSWAASGHRWAMIDCASGSCLELDADPGIGLMGRPFVYGRFDCYSAIRDYLYQQRGLLLGDYPRREWGEWQRPDWDIWERSFLNEPVRLLGEDEPLQQGDVLLMCIHNRHANHAAVVHDPDRSLVFEHRVNELSGLTVIGPNWQKRVKYRVRPTHG